jgi:hypothetical protein
VPSAGRGPGRPSPFPGGPPAQFPSPPGPARPEPERTGPEGPGVVVPPPPVGPSRPSVLHRDLVERPAMPTPSPDADPWSVWQPWPGSDPDSVPAPPQAGDRPGSAAPAMPSHPGRATGNSGGLGAALPSGPGAVPAGGTDAVGHEMPPADRGLPADQGFAGRDVTAGPGAPTADAVQTDPGLPVVAAASPADAPSGRSSDHTLADGTPSPGTPAGETPPDGPTAAGNPPDPSGEER